jgi:hypothetical protein
MKFRGLIAAAVVLLALGGVLYWSEHHKPAENSASSSNTPAIVKVDPAAVTGVTIKTKGAEPVVLSKSGSNWQISAPTPAAADSGAVTGMLSTLAPLSSVRVIEDKATNLAEYGLSDPSVELDITTNNKTTRVLLGDNTPTGDDVYAAVAGDPRVFTATASAKTSIDKSENDLRDKRLIPVDSSSVSEIQLNRKGEAIQFGRAQNGWQLQKPQAYATDSYQVDDLLQQVTTAKWDPSVTPQKAASTWAHAQPFASVTLTSKSGTDTLDVRKEQEDYYAKSSALGKTYKVDPSLAPALSAALSHNLDDFRNKQLFNFGYTDPDKIEYRSGSTNLTLTHAGNDWWSNGRKMDAESVEAVVTALRDLSASKFVDSGFNAPTIDIAVTSGNGKRVEKAQLQKTADGVIGKREDNPSLYFFETTAVDNLTKALAGVKPAGAPVPAG